MLHRRSADLSLTEEVAQFAEDLSGARQLQRWILGHALAPLAGMMQAPHRQSARKSGRVF